MRRLAAAILVSAVPAARAGAMERPPAPSFAPPVEPATAAPPAPDPAAEARLGPIDRLLLRVHRLEDLAARVDVQVQKTLELWQRALFLLQQRWLKVTLLVGMATLGAMFLTQLQWLVPPYSLLGGTALASGLWFFAARLFGGTGLSTILGAWGVVLGGLLLRAVVVRTWRRWGPKTAGGR